MPTKTRERATATRKRVTRPSRAKTSHKIEPDEHRRDEIERWLDSKGVIWAYDPAVQLDMFDRNRSLSNQARFHAINEDLVERYTAAMDRGDVFPAVVATFFAGGKRLINVDGNHRYLAWEQRDEPVPAYIIEGDTQTIVAMTYEANTKHGLPTSVEERQQHAVWMLDNSATQDTAAASTGLTISQVRSAWNKASVERRARNLKVKDWNRLNQGVRARLGAVRTNEGFTAAVKLAVDAQLNTAEVNEMVTELNRFRGGEEQVDQVKKIKARFKGRIQKSGGGVLNVRRHDVSQKGLWLSAMGFMDKVTAVEVVDSLSTPSEFAEAERRIKNTMGTLDLMLSLVKEKAAEVKRTE